MSFSRAKSIRIATSMNKIRVDSPADGEEPRMESNLDGVSFKLGNGKLPKSMNKIALGQRGRII